MTRVSLNMHAEMGKTPPISPASGNEQNIPSCLSPLQARVNKIGPLVGPALRAGPTKKVKPRN